MRTPLLATIFGLSLVACAGQIDGGGPGGDDDVPAPDCGNSAVNTGEGCDDGNNISGDGCSATCDVEVTPRLDVSVDKPTVATELNTTHMVTVTLTGSDGFGGAVTLVPSIVDAADLPLAAWTIVLDNANLNVPVDGTATAIATITIPSENKGLVGTAKFVATSTAGTGTFTASSAITALNQVTIGVTLSGGQCVYPADGTINVTLGSKLRFLNNATENITIHMQGFPQGNPLPQGLDHQPDPGSTPATAYEQTLDVGGTLGRMAQWYCHDPGPTVGGLRIQSVAAAL